jgi:hypothetical protein
MKFRLKAENNKTHCCEYHKGQNMSKIFEDTNFVRSKLDYRTVKFTCSICEYERIYEQLPPEKEIIAFT